MMMNKGQLSNILRNLGLIRWMDRCRFHYEKLRMRKKNARFRREHPEVTLPPDYLIYESFQLDYRKYYTDSARTASWIADLIKKYSTSQEMILDWGCGPGRIIRHMHKHFPKSKLYGTDYNHESIEWCSEFIKTATFKTNRPSAKLPFQNSFLDVIYGISIFTHLSEKQHVEWFAELIRVLKPGGILLVSTQGNAFIPILSQREKEKYARGELIIRAGTNEGHRTFSAFQPPSYLKGMFAGTELLASIQNEAVEGKKPQQDLWILRKPKKADVDLYI